MISKITVSFILPVFITVAFCRDDFMGRCWDLYHECRFKFDNETGLSTYDGLYSSSDKPFTPLIVSKNAHQRLGVLNINGIEPHVIFRSRPRGLTELNPAFTSTFVKPIPISGAYGSGLAVQSVYGQFKKIDKRSCAVIWFTQYQLLTKGHEPRVLDNIVAKKEDMKCVVFLIPRYVRV